MKIAAKSTLLLCLVAACTACGTKSDKGKNREMVVKTAQVKTVSGEERKDFSFIAKPLRSSDLSFRVGGPIEQFDVYAGSHYRQGALIAAIDPRDFRIRRERTEAIYNQAKAEFERIEVLYKKDNISASQYEKARAEYTTAKTAFETAVNELEDTRLTAPFNGYIGEVYIEKHQDVKPSQRVVSLVDISELRIEAYVTQQIAFGADKLSDVSLRFDADPAKIYSARVAEVSKSTTSNNLSYLLTALLPNKDGKLLAGMSGKIIFNTATDGAPAVLAIPQSALCHRPTEGDYVWVVDDATDTVHLRKVTLGNILPDGMVAISAGLEPSESVALSGLRFLSDGMQVKVQQ